MCAAPPSLRCAFFAYSEGSHCALVEPRAVRIRPGVQQKVSRGFDFDPIGGGVAGRFTGECFITNYSTSVPVGDNIVWTATLTVTGAITRESS